jgi:hypothetical protein
VPSRERQAKNEALFREVNERISDVSVDFGTAPREQVRFVCECTDVKCSEWLALAVGEYETIREDPTQFLVAPGHERAPVEQVVKRTDRYLVVRKEVDQRFFEATDPRS